MKSSCLVYLFVTSAATVFAAPVRYTVDPNHTHPSFEVDHMGGLSTWRGTFKNTSGVIVLDTTAKTGSVDIVIDAASVDLAQDKLNEHVSGPEMLDVSKYPTASYKGTLGDFNNGLPKSVTGNLTLHGVTKPVALVIASFKCIEHPMLKREVCGAEITGTFNRADFGVNYGQQYGFRQDVVLHIQVEAIKD